ncbi:ABC transporter substrate-binding protein [Neobacillus niacini]|uniref:ABC transporter substrate-binding protein n=1 Tax=Neobacillus niacini TaxID=86668 RepID=UPI002FFF6BAA
MDHYLLTLWNSTSSGEVKVKDIAENLYLSTKQTRRKLGQWHDEGWLTFTSGRGRGNESKLLWKRDVESEYEQQYSAHLEKYSIEQVSKLLLFQWSTETKQRLMTQFQSKFGFQQEGQDRLIIPRFYPFLTYHPLKAADVHSANLIANLYNRVVALDDNNTVIPELAHSWEVQDKRLTLYIRKDVSFHDGSILKAEDVVQTFLQMKQDETYAELWKPITSISSPAPFIVELVYPNGCTYILPLLSMISASIYKESPIGSVIGTGSFYLGENTDEKTVLHAFKHYYGERPLLDSVEFIQVSREFGNVYYGAHESREVGTFEVESDSGFGIVVMNAFRQTDIARKEVRDYIHMLIDKHRPQISMIDARISENSNGCLIGYSKNYMIPEIPKPVLSNSLTMKYVGYTKAVSLWLKDILEHAGITVELEEVSFHDALYHDHLKGASDLFIHGEIFEMNQSFSYFNFMKNTHSPLSKLTLSDSQLQKLIQAYDELPFENWMDHHLKIEDYLIKNSLCIPLYYSKRQIPFSINLMNVEIKHFGYVDLSKLWMKPKREA